MDVLTKQKGVRKHRTDKEIFEAIAEFGDLSMADFCELMEITDSTYYNWQNKYKQMQERVDGRIPVILTDEDLNADRPSLEIGMPDGRVFRFFGQLDPVLVKSLM